MFTSYKKKYEETLAKLNNANKVIDAYEHNIVAYKSTVADKEKAAEALIEDLKMELAFAHSRQKSTDSKPSGYMKGLSFAIDRAIAYKYM